MKVFRGFRDINPDQICHRYISNGYYGPAIYLALNFEGAEDYTESRKSTQRKVVGEYEIDDSKMISLSNEDILNLHSFNPYGLAEISKKLNLSPELAKKLQTDIQIAPEDIGSLVTTSGYSALKLTGRVEGGEQVVLPQSSTEPLSLIKIHVGSWIFGHNQAEGFKEEVERLFGNYKKENGYHWFSYTISQQDEAHELLAFHDNLYSNIVQINYLDRTVIYDDDEE